MQLHLVIEDSGDITRDTCWFAFRRCPNLRTITIDGQVWSWLGLGLANPNPNPTPTPTPNPNQVEMDGHLKLTDFGLAKVKQRNNVTRASICGKSQVASSK